MDMKNKKSKVILGFLALTVIFLTFPRSANAFEINLTPGGIIDMSGHMGRNDYLYWDFTSTLSDITVVALSNYEYSIFDHVYNSPYTTMLSEQQRSDSGWWRPPHSDIWHLIFENVGSYETYVVYNGIIDNDYFGKDMLPRDLIIGFSGFIAVIGIGSIMLTTQHFKNKKSKILF